MEFVSSNTGPRKPPPGPIVPLPTDPLSGNVIFDRTTSPVPKPPIPAPPAPPSQAFTNPAWWKEYRYSGAYDPNAELAMTVNALLPSMSPIDQQYWSSWLYQQDPAKFANYDPARKIEFGPEPGESGRGAFASSARATQAWDFLRNTLLNTDDTNPANDKKIADMGPAVPWLQRVMEATKRYAPAAGGGTGYDRRTRAQERALQSDLTSLWSEAQSSQDLQPYLELAKRFVAPSYMSAPISTPTPAGFRESAYPANSYNSYSRMNFVSNPRYI